MFRKINETLETKCFDAFDATLPYRYRLRQLGYTIGTMFIRSYEQGERVYTSMLCRGYGRNSHLFLKKKHSDGPEWGFLLKHGVYHRRPGHGLANTRVPVLIEAGMLF